MYYLYHIKGKKWGCTQHLIKRLSKQGYTLTDVCEIIEKQDLDEAADLEKELNLKCGYPWNDSQDYRVMYRAVMASTKVKKTKSESEIERWITFSKEWGKIQGKIQGNKNVKSGHMERMRAKGNPSLGGKIGGKITTNKKSVCPHCGKEGQIVAMGRWHFNNCKQKS